MKKEITIADLQGYDWKEVFGEGSGCNTDKSTDVVHPSCKCSTVAPNTSDVVEIIAAVNGENDGADWLGVFRLKDGRFLVACGSCDYTGWDCRAGNTLTVADSFEQLLIFGLSASQADRLELREERNDALREQEKKEERRYSGFDLESD